MGRCADADLFYGFITEVEDTSDAFLWLGEDYWEDEDNENLTADERYLDMIGFKSDKSTDDNYWEERKVILANCPITIGYYGYSDGGTCTFLAVKQSHSSVSDYGGSLISQGQIFTDPKWNTEIKDYCKLMGIDISKFTIGWNLTCSYG